MIENMHIVWCTVISHLNQIWCTRRHQNCLYYILLAIHWHAYCKRPTKCHLLSATGAIRTTPRSQCSKWHADTYTASPMCGPSLWPGLEPSVLTSAGRASALNAGDGSNLQSSEKRTPMPLETFKKYTRKPRPKNLKKAAKKAKKPSTQES